MASTNNVSSIHLILTVTFFSIEYQKSISRDNKKLLLKLVDISRGKLIHPDLRSSADHSGLGYPRLARNASSSLNVSSSQRSLRPISEAPLIPAFHENARREQKRLIDIENIKIANKLMSVRGSKTLKKEILDKEFDKFMRAKAVLCKLPIIDMA